MKLEPRDYIALVGAIVTVSTVLWRGGQITSDVASTKEAVQAMAPVVTRLDSATARLDATVEANKVRLTDLTRRVETLEQRR